MPAKPSLPTQKRLFALSGGRCYRCKKDVFVSNDRGENVLIGQIIHIVGPESGSPRYDADLPMDEKHSEANLMVMCVNCHTQVDKDVAGHTVEKLRTMKRIHEETEGGHRTKSISINDLMKDCIDATLYLVLIWPCSLESATRAVFRSITPTTKETARRSLNRLLYAGYAGQSGGNYTSTSLPILEYWRFKLGRRARNTPLENYYTTTSHDARILESLFSSSWFRNYLKLGFDLLESRRDSNGILRFDHEHHVPNRIGRMIDILATVAACFSKKTPTSDLAPTVIQFDGRIGFDQFIEEWISTKLDSKNLGQYLIGEFNTASEYLGDSPIYNSILDYIRRTKAFLCIPMDFCWKMNKIGRVESSFFAAFGIC